MAASNTSPLKVTVFIPCLVDQVAPKIGLATMTLLRALGCEPQYQAELVCCGQPAFNAGQRDQAKNVAQHVLRHLDLSLPLVVPSGSCAAMLKNYYYTLFDQSSREAELHTRAQSLRPQVFELSQYLLQFPTLRQVFSGVALARKVAFMNSCHSARELGLCSEPTKLLELVQGLEVVPLQSAGSIATADTPPKVACCGFGGLFCAKFPEISQSMARTLFEAAEAAQVETILSNDPGCIVHLRQALHARRAQGVSTVREVLHLAEFLVKLLPITDAPTANTAHLAQEQHV